MNHLAALVALLFALFPMGLSAEATPTIEPIGYAHPEWLVDSEWLDRQLSNDQIAIIALTPADDFAQGHIPGAVQVDWPDLALSESSHIDDWRSQMEQILTNLGIERSDTVVVYDDGTLYAPRLWWILDQLGHQDVRILNGGFPAWTAAAATVETGAAASESAQMPYVGVPNDDAIATVDEVVAALDDPATVLVDARSHDEYADGHIPGAVSYPFTEIANPEQPRYWKSAEVLESQLEALGITRDKRVIPYCSSGVRSAGVYFTLRLMGYDNVTLFSGSFDEWTADPSRPVEQ